MMLACVILLLNRLILPQDNSCMKIVCLFISLLISTLGFSQTISTQLASGIKKLEADGQFKNSIISFYVVDSKTGKLVFEKNGATGLAPASCQKIVTSVSAFELLGHAYIFKTYITHHQPIQNGVLQGNLYFVGDGDPTLGSWRWNTTSEWQVVQTVLNTLQKNNIKSIAGELVVDDGCFAFNPLPDGWIWEDIGNYYGAGVWGLNWRENQFELTFKTGSAVNDSTTIIATKPPFILNDYSFLNFVKTGAKGSGDNAYLFSAPFTKNIIAKGTVPLSADGFAIDGATPNPPKLFLQTIYSYLKINHVPVAGNGWTYTEKILNHERVVMPKGEILDSIVSPPLDSINYWFLKKSVNLYGEALVKTMAYKKYLSGSTDSGISIIKDFWSKKGINKSALNIIDGSGLSPANRITANALVAILQYAQKQNWYPSFYNALPVINNIKMKDGYISGVRSYAGYVQSKSGARYTFSFIVNNFDGSPATIREKIWEVLDLLK
jgi:D-alanyl-D-alanine carboxypeptidase/D-alanyl-D-alanine-endopeptidase (penicillin-binding protein 4)